MERVQRVEGPQQIGHRQRVLVVVVGVVVVVLTPNGSRAAVADAERAGVLPSFVGHVGATRWMRQVAEV
jgi:hypothetical protein